MRPRLYAPEDYPLVCEWWAAWKWPRILESSLPPVGVMVEGEAPMCCGWLYRTDSDLRIIEWIISNPAIREGRTESLALLLAALEDIARKDGARAVVSFVRHPGLLRHMKKRGFAPQDKGMTTMLKIVSEG